MPAPSSGGRAGLESDAGRPLDDASSAHFQQALRQKLRDPEFRRTEGFPFGENETILALSDPPYITACPNPFLADFLTTDQCQDLRTLTPFAVDLRVARHDVYSLAHTYHTKVSPLAIARYIEHFTKPGDVVLDLFCGSGMTGLAAAGATIEFAEQKPYLSASRPRRAVLLDLCPAATQIAAGYASRFQEEDIVQARQVLKELEDATGTLYAVRHTGFRTRSEAWAKRSGPERSRAKGRLEYLVWSEVWGCPQCDADVVFGEAAYDWAAGKMAAAFPCTRCGHSLHKRGGSRRMESYHDPLLRASTLRPRLVPLWAAYRYEGHRYYRRAVPADAGMTPALDPRALPSPQAVLRGERYFKDALAESYGISHVHQFYTLRNLHALGMVFARARAQRPGLARLLRFLATSLAVKASKLMNYNADGVGRVMKGTLYTSSLIQECNPFWLAEIALRDIARFGRAARHDPRNIFVSTQSAAAVTLPESSIDYVWIDPPFGKSLMYAELNQLWEWWLGLRTADSHEAVLDLYRDKNLAAYTDLMSRCLAQAHRALKPGRWMTVVFHNSDRAVWDALQEAVRRAGFVVADVRILDKKLLTYKQSQQGLARCDLVLSAYKPVARPVSTKLRAGTVGAVWRFVRRRLGRLPAPKNGEQIVERTRHYLYDRMVAHHLRRGISVPLSAQEFFAGLRERFVERSGMYFTR